MDDLIIKDKKKIQNKSKISTFLKDKKVRLTVGGGLKMEVTKVDSRLADKEFKDAVVEFSTYIDDTKGESTSMKGFVMQINKRLKAKFGSPVDEIFEPEKIEILAVIRKKIATIIKNGERLGLSRRNIKDACYDAIDKIYDLLASDMLQ